MTAIYTNRPQARPYSFVSHQKVYETFIALQGQTMQNVDITAKSPKNDTRVTPVLQNQEGKGLLTLAST